MEMLQESESSKEAKALLLEIANFWYKKHIDDPLEELREWEYLGMRAYQFIKKYDLAAEPYNPAEDVTEG